MTVVQQTARADRLSPDPGADSPGPRFPLVAPLRHTALLVAAFLALAVGGAFFQKSGGPAGPRGGSATGLYLSVLAAEWGLVYFVWKGGLKRTGTSLRELVGGRWGTWRDALRDVFLAVGLWAGWKIVSLGLEAVSGPDRAASIQTLLPRDAVEVALWILVSFSAGIAEEIVFRGYLQRQFTALTRSPWLAVLLQGALFGVSHGYQGVAASARIALYGVLFGLLAVWRGSLRPGILAHAGTDIVAGIFRI